MVAASAGAALARWGNSSDRLGSRHPLNSVNSVNSALVTAPAKFSHLFAASPPSAMYDLASSGVTSVPAASYEVVPVAQDSIVAAFGSHLATQTVIASDADPNTPGIQLPTQLGGTTVEVNGRRAGLFFVSPTQVNYVLPDVTETGTASLVVKAGDGVATNGTAMVTTASPAIFTADSSGKGVPAAYILRAKPGGQQSYESVYQLNAAGNGYITKPIGLGSEDETVYLVLYVSGIRRATTGAVRVLIGGNEITPEYAGPAPNFVSLDQVNVIIPRSLIGRGTVKTSVTVAGNGASNLVDIEIAGATGISPPQITGFGGGQALAGQTMVINGSGFSPIPSENIVHISGLTAEVTAATTTSLTVMVPFGVTEGKVRVSTPMGEGVSSSILPVRTSISGIVENTMRQPLPGVVISVVTPNKIAITDLDGHFVLPDVPPGVQLVEIDGGKLGIYPPYPKIPLKVTVLPNHDNAFARAIPLQQATGSGATVGDGTSFGANGGAERVILDSQPVSIETEGFRLEIEGSTKAKFPNNDTVGEIFLTPVQDSRTPVELPAGYFSSSVAQITPFGVSLDPGAKLIFPNKDGFPAGAPAILFRFDQNEGKFVQAPARAAVSANGLWIETEPNAIKTTTYYFATVPRNTTTITGRVFEQDRKTPVAGALARFRGQEAFTDGAGAYVLRFVSVKEGEGVSVEVSMARPNGRVDRKQSDSVAAAINGTTKAPDVFMPSTTENRPPTISGPTKLEIEEGKTRDDRIVVTDPDANQTIQVRVEGAPFATVIRGGLAAATAYSLRLAPNFAQAGRYKLKLTATDNLGLSDTHEIDLTVKNVNRAPTANNQAVVVDEDMSLAIKLEGADPDGDRLGFTIVDRPANGRLSGSAPNITYTPNQNFAGADRFTFKVNDGEIDSNIATVAITVKPVNDAPQLNMPGDQAVSEGQPINLTISATDPDAGQKLTFTAAGLPEGASFTQATATSAQFRWTPGFAQAGTYAITLKVADDASPSLSDTKELRITVNDVPLFTTPSPKKVVEGQLLSFDITATSGLPIPVTLSVTEMPSGATFQNPGINTLQFRWTPGFTQAGNYLISIKASIGIQPSVSEIRQVQISVLDSQHDFAEDPADLTILGAADASSSSKGGALGSSVAIGDLDGDGIDDLVAGAPSDNSVGQVHIFFGRFNPKETIDLAKRAADVTIRGEASDDRFGSSVAIGDINGDGKADLIIGAPMADASRNAPDSGKVYAIFGNLISGTYDIAKISKLTILGAARSDHLGASLAVGRLSGASNPAGLLIGAPLVDVPGKESPLVDAGAVYGFFGGGELSGLKDLGSSSSDFTLTGAVVNGQFGAALATGNFNGDEFVDIAVAAPAADSGALKTAGVVYLISGSPSLKGSVSAPEVSSLVINGSDSGDAAGSSLAMGDVSGDGFDELIIGAPGGDGPNNVRPDSGEVYVIFGGPAGAIRRAQLTIFGGSASVDEIPDALGSSVAVGDFTGDGILDLIMGAPGADPVDSARPPAGAAYMIFGGRNLDADSIDLMSKAPDLKIFGAKSGARLGNGGFALGRLDLVGANDLAIGIPEASTDDNGASGVGEIRVLRGVIR
jgi:uncharacterized protein (TIGR03437 family)